MSHVFIARGWQKLDDFCDSGWESVSPFVMALARGAVTFIWMKKEIRNDFMQWRFHSGQLSFGNNG